MGFKCNDCGFCCKGEKGIQVNLTVGDIYRICEFLMITVEEFFDKYGGLKPFKDPRKPDGYDIDMGLEMPCKFWKNGKCSIYSARPLNCRIFPYWLLVRAPEDKLKGLLKGKCEYTLDKKSMKKYEDYQKKVGDIIMLESSMYEIGKRTKTKKIDEEIDISMVKAKIVENLDQIKYDKVRLIKAEEILKPGLFERFRS